MLGYLKYTLVLLKSDSFNEITLSNIPLSYRIFRISNSNMIRAIEQLHILENY